MSAGNAIKNMFRGMFIGVIFAFFCFSAFAENDDDDDLLLNERVSEWLRESDIDTGFSFNGDGNITATIVNQNVPRDYDSGSCSYQGNIYVRYLGRTDTFGYGCECRIKTDSGIIKTGSAIVNEAYAFIEGDKFGRINIGYTGTAADKFTIGGNSLFVAYGGPDSGNLSSFYNQSAGTIIGTGCHIDDGKAAKIAWFSPTVRGFSFAVSYTLDSKRATPFKTKYCSENCKSEHNICWDYAHTSGFSRDILTISGKYEYGSNDDFNAIISAGGWFGKGKSGTIEGGVHDVRAYQIGAILGYKQLKIAFGFIDCGRSIVDKHRAVGESTIFNDAQEYDVHDQSIGLKYGADAGKIYTYGVAYKIEKLTVSAGYFRSVVNFSDKESERAIANIVTIGAEYRVNKTLSLYAEYNNIVTKTCDRARIYAKACGQAYEGANRANMIMFGSKLRF